MTLTTAPPATPTPLLVDPDVGGEPSSENRFGRAKPSSGSSSEAANVPPCCELTVPAMAMPRIRPSVLALIARLPTDKVEAAVGVVDGVPAGSAPMNAAVLR